MLPNPLRLPSVTATLRCALRARPPFPRQRSLARVGPVLVSPDAQTRFALSAPQTRRRPQSQPRPAAVVRVLTPPVDDAVFFYGGPFQYLLMHFTDFPNPTQQLTGEGREGIRGPASPEAAPASSGRTPTINRWGSEIRWSYDVSLYGCLTKCSSAVTNDQQAPMGRGAACTHAP